MKHYCTCLSIAGSDPYGGAGIQADLKTFSALGCYGSAVITALTVQNSCGVVRSVPVEADLVYEQAAAVMSDLPPMAVKIGMVANTAVIRALSRLLTDFRPPFVVLDPIMVSSSGKRLLDAAAIDEFVDRLMPLCTLITPNMPELEVLTSPGSPEERAFQLADRTGCPNVLAKGGHAAGDPHDVLVSATGAIRFDGRRVATKNTHGTGCTLSAAIAAYVARGCALPDAVSNAKKYVEQALVNGAEVSVGKGNGSMNHFFKPHPLIIEDF